MIWGNNLLYSFTDLFWATIGVGYGGIYVASRVHRMLCMCPITSFWISKPAFGNVNWKYFVYCFNIHVDEILLCIFNARVNSLTGNWLSRHVANHSPKITSAQRFLSFKHQTCRLSIHQKIKKIKTLQIKQVICIYIFKSFHLGFWWEIKP